MLGTQTMFLEHYHDPKQYLEGMSGAERGGITDRNFIWHGTNRLTDPVKINSGTDTQRALVGKYLMTHAPYSHVRLRKIKVWLYCPEPGIGYIHVQYGSTNPIKWADDTTSPQFIAVDSDFPNTFIVEQGHKYGWLGMEFAPPISMGMTDWHPLYQYAVPTQTTGKALLQQPPSKCPISSLAHLFICSYGTINPNHDGLNPGNPGWPGAPQNMTNKSQDAKGNLIYKFYWETKNDDTDAAWKSIRFIGDIEAGGSILQTNLIDQNTKIYGPKGQHIGKIQDHRELALLQAMTPEQRVCYMLERTKAEAEKETTTAKPITTQNKLAQQRPTKVRVPEVEEEPRHFGWGFSKLGVLHDAYGLPVQQEEPNREDRSRSIEERIMMKLECIENDLTLQGQAHSALCDDMEALHERFLEKEDEMLGNDEDDSFICDDEELSMSSENECSDDEDDFNPPKLFKKDTLLLDDEEDTMEEDTLIDQVVELEDNPLYGKDVPEYEGNPFECETPY